MHAVSTTMPCGQTFSPSPVVPLIVPACRAAALVAFRSDPCVPSISLAILARSLSLARDHFSPCFAPLRSSTSFIDPCSSQRQQLRRPSPLSPSLPLPSSALLILLASRDRRRASPLPSSPLPFSPLPSSPLLSSPLLSSPLRNIRTYSSGRPTDRSYARPTLAAMLLQEATVDGGGGSDCRHTTATDRCYRVAVAVAAAILFSCQRKCCSSEGKEEISALR